MKTKHMIGWMMLGGMLCVVGVLTPAGCESTKSTDNVITVTPSSATVSNAGDVVTFAASFASTNVDLALPLTWTVSDGALGHIKSSAGLSAVYEAAAPGGNNVITVHDQGDSEGVAVVTQL